MRSNIESITPQMAQAFLDRNTGNRKIYQGRVTTMARIMKQGRWMVTHQAIAFDHLGNLIDGQHRLMAVIEAGIPVKMLVARDVDPEARLHIDTGLNRSVYDIASIMKSGASEKGIQIAGYALAYTLMAKPSLRHFRRVNPAPEEILDFYAKHHDAIEWVVERMMNQNKAVSSRVVLVPIVRAWYTQPHLRLSEFIDVFKSGIMKEPGDQMAIVFRDMVNAGRSMKVFANEREKYQKMERALRAFLDRAVLNRLYVAQDELFPFPEEVEE